MEDFKPTYLYIKQHSLTGKLYFGKTIKTNKKFEKYLGSGKHWLTHVKKHGVNKVETLWFCLFTEKEPLVEFALMFSSLMDIENSSEWLNLKFENGLDGGILSDESRKNLSVKWKGELNPNFNRVYSEAEKVELGNNMKGKKHSDETKSKISESTSGILNHFYGKKHTEESKIIMSEKLSGEKSPNFGRKHTQEFCDSISKRMTKEKNHRFNTGARFDVEAPDGKILNQLTTAELSELFGYRNWSSLFKKSKKGIVCGIKLIKVHK